MTHLEAKQGILKVDARGRVQTPPERREALLDEFERLGGRREALRQEVCRGTRTVQD
jgi:hypothetical protein